MSYSSETTSTKTTQLSLHDILTTPLQKPRLLANIAHLDTFSLANDVNGDHYDDDEDVGISD